MNGTVINSPSRAPMREGRRCTRGARGTQEGFPQFVRGDTSADAIAARRYFLECLPQQELA
jgi:hypothetical protein